MEQQKLPNVTTAIVLSILSYICCCFSVGLGGILLSGIALYLTNKDEKLYKENPEGYSNYSTLKTAKIVAIIGLILGIIAIITVVVQIFMVGGWEAYMEQQREVYEQLGIPID